METYKGETLRQSLFFVFLRIRCKFAVMKIRYICLCAMMSMSVASWANLVVDCTARQALTVTPPANTGLETVYVVYGGANTTLTYTSETGSANVEWQSFDERGGGYAETVSNVTRDGVTTRIENPKVNCGYIIIDGAKRHYFWLVDYVGSEFSISDVSFPSEQDCGSVTLQFNANCPTINYYSVTGVPKVLDREIKVTYNTLVWSEENKVYDSVESTTTLDNLGERQVLTAPLCDTQFVIEGDQFLKQWGVGQTYSTDVFHTNSIEVHTSATQESRNNDNEQGVTEDSLGGSAPAEIQFVAYCTDAVSHKEWDISRNSDFSTIDYRFNEEAITHTFTEQGTFYAKFIGSNSDASCTEESDVYTISIGESLLDCPNAFSPNASTGYNDEWKVTYKSILDFHCWIFDRYGNLMTEFTDPSQGWDGKYKGKYVKAGVYYYVIEAKGSDGKNYKKKGDINIIKSTRTDKNETTE